MTTYIRSRPATNGIANPVLVLRVLEYDHVSGKLVVAGRYGSWEMDETYARKHYLPVKENSDAISTGLQEELQGRGKDGSGAGGEQGQRAATPGAETGGEEGAGEAA